MGVVLLIAFILLLITGAIWTLGWFFGLALTVKIALTVIVFAFALVAWLTVYLVKVTASKQLERAMLAQGAKQAESEAPDRRKEILALQQQVHRAIAALRKSRLGRGGGTALYALPWYVIIGPPGAGKTTAIRHSGLDFPLEEAGAASAYRGTGGTRNCDWWFTNEAILLDTAGRYATDVKDQDEWHAFLDLLRRHRPRKPINGLLIALPMSDLALADSEQVTHIARRLRARIDEVTTRLKMLVPVYVLFTKTDMVAGFSEFWSDLRLSERAQPWGMAFPMTPNLDPQEGFERTFDQLLRTLHARAVRRLGTERNVVVRRRLSQFPVEFSSLRTNLSLFVAQLFQKNSFQETPALRGTYFTSGTQNRRPTSRVVASMARAFGLHVGETPGSAIEAKSYFLGDVFRRVIFPDQALAGATEGERRRQLLIRLGAASFALMMSASLVLPAFLTFLQNRQLVRTSAEIGAGLESANWTDTATLEANAPRLDAAEGRIRQLAEWRENGTPVQLRWGMYTGNDLESALRGAYIATLTRALIKPAKLDLEDRLRAIDSGPIRTSDNFNREFDYLKLYLMLGDPQRLDPAWAAPRLAHQWSQTSHTRVKGEEEIVLPHVLFVLELLKRNNLAAVDLDKGLVGRARSILAQVPQMERLYEALVRDPNTEIAPIRRETVFYGAVAPFVQSRKGVKVDGAYTKQGWSRVRSVLSEERMNLAAEQWVLGDTNEANAQGTADKLRELYFERYRNAWNDFISDLQVQDPGNAELALDELNALSEPEWPYLRLIRTLSDNVTLDMDDPAADKSLVEKATDKAKEFLEGGAPPKKRLVSPVERAFKPILAFGLPPESAGDTAPATGLSQYEALLAKLVGALTDLRDAETGTDPRKVSDVFQDAFRTTSALLSAQDGFTRPMLSPLLMNPIRLAWSSVVQDAGAAAGATWESSVWQKWHEKLEGKYPFAQSPTDVALVDFVDFFSPGDGVLWSFYDESLKATLDRSGSSFVPSRRFKSAIGYTPDFLDVCLKRGQEFTTVLFPPKTGHVAVTFDVNLHSVSPTIAEVTFEVDGVSHTYRNEPEQWMTVTWPGKSPHGARLRVRGANGLDEEVSRPGDFGFFRLLEAAVVKPGRAGGRADGAPTLVASWDLKASREGSFVNLDLRPSRNENPLSPGYFRGYSCPRIIASK